MNNYNQLKDVLNEIFELNKADLDFGIYRIMNQKRKQVNEFIEKQLPEDIKQALSETQSTDKTEIENELKTLKKNLDDAGIVAEESPKYKTLMERLSGLENSEVLEQEVFSHLANFFKRYYKDGDFISMRRYKKDVYAIPYEGEEVKLHWANHDQYYIKSSENFKNYTFKTSDGKTISFQLKEVSTEQNNNKAQGDAERRFAIYKEEPVEETETGLTIHFIYEPFTKATKQESLLAEALELLTHKVPSKYTSVFALSPTEKNSKRTLIEKHLNDYVSKNSFDYFIHKDLGGFLSRELDFYIKNEVLYLDDINTKQSDFFVAQLSKVKAIKVVAGKVIDFLAQIENFQKKLWLKKKFVIRTDYCITLDKIPNTYYPEILANKAQLQEWKALFDVDIQNAEQLIFEEYLVLDTKFFDESFKDRLLAEFDDLDESTNGLLINSENFQGLNILNEKYQNKIQSIYIDPPFNLEHSGEFLYKTDFLDSSWTQLVFDRAILANLLLKSNGVISVRSDYHGEYLVRLIMNKIFGINNFRNQTSINRIFKNKSTNDVKTLSYSFDYLSIYSKSEEFTFVNPIIKLEKTREQYWRHMNDSEGQGNSKIFFGLELHPPIGKHFKYSQEKIDEKIKIKELRLDCKNCGYEHYEGIIITCPKCGKQNFNPKYLVHSTDEKVLGTNWTDIPGYSNTIGFSTENSESLLRRYIELTSNKQDIILDYFLGSGTTTSVAHKLNRKWIGIEMANYFYDFPLKKMKRVLKGNHSGVSKELNWQGGGMFKYFVLETYEDTLNNLSLISTFEIDFNNTVKEEYIIKYMLDLESRDRLFNLEMFRKPFDYQLKVTENNELKPTKVDLVETFNYLIGLYVSKVQRVKDIKVVEGTTRTGIKTLVIWRDLETTTHDEVEKLLRRFYDSQRTKEFQQIYINGDHHLENLRTEGDSFKIKGIEETFFKKMFNEIEL